MALKQLNRIRYVVAGINASKHHDDVRWGSSVRAAWAKAIAVDDGELQLAISTQASGVAWGRLW
eukprot:11941573-Alexandrium_andersonii.AAC.1